MTDPTPGSPVAVERGCICPVLDNAHGQGIPMTPVGDRPVRHFWITAECPVHDSVAIKEEA